MDNLIIQDLIYAIDHIQKEIGEWSTYNFGHTSGYKEQTNPLLGLNEEVGELNHAHLKQAQGIRGDQAANIKDAIGDIFIYLCDYCNRNGILLSNAIMEAWDEVSKRDWKEFPLNGRDA